MAKESKRSYTTRLKLVPNMTLAVNPLSATGFEDGIDRKFSETLRITGILRYLCRTLISYVFQKSYAALNETRGIDFLLVDLEMEVKETHSMGSILELITSLYNIRIDLSYDGIVVMWDIIPFVATENLGNFGGNLSKKCPRDLCERIEELVDFDLTSVRKCAIPPIRLFTISPFSLCPKVELPLNLFDKTINNTLCLRKERTCFQSGNYTMKNKRVYLCINDYFGQNTDSNSTFDQIDYVGSYMSLVMTLISIVCLLITIITYTLFRSLRTLPGKNNLALCVTLLCAQLLYQFGSNATRDQLVCQVLGGAIHFTWLSSITWMNICCFHMFRIFAMEVRVRGTNKEAALTRAMIGYIVYSLAIAAIFVVANIVTSLMKSGFADSGYGGNICYISTSQMIGFTFAAPIGFLLIANFAFFVAVIIKIQRVPDIKSSTHGSRRNLFVYMKLSCITGLFWIFGFVYQFSKLEAFGYVFIILNAGQGVFIMVAFVFNKRVFDLYRTRIKGQKLTRSGQSSSQIETRFSNINSK